MPYIKPENRKYLDPHIDNLAGKIEIGNAGELNYVLTRLALQFLMSQGVDYTGINTVAGVLQKVAAEFDARVTRPYEELKVFQNGDVPEYRNIVDIIAEKYPVS